MENPTNVRKSQLLLFLPLHHPPLQKKFSFLPLLRTHQLVYWRNWLQSYNGERQRVLFTKVNWQRLDESLLDGRIYPTPPSIIPQKMAVLAGLRVHSKLVFSAICVADRGLLVQREPLGPNFNLANVHPSLQNGSTANSARSGDSHGANSSPTAVRRSKKKVGYYQNLFGFSDDRRGWLDFRVCFFAFHARWIHQLGRG